HQTNVLIFFTYDPEAEPRGILLIKFVLQLIYPPEPIDTIAFSPISNLQPLPIEYLSLMINLPFIFK
ncbi:hypothetical protein, partial [Flavobacterium franklandianum]|uniref:hypothetical protein n=1 Tax=Flavobacterium franklandianum TaxID=2594430 RepID=UPI001C3F5BF3